jgi:hypothetical protein
MLFLQACITIGPVQNKAFYLSFFLGGEENLLSHNRSYAQITPQPLPCIVLSLTANQRNYSVNPPDEKEEHIRSEEKS